MSGAAQREEDLMNEQMLLGATGTDSGNALREMAAERLAAHRNRRAAEAAKEREMNALVEARRYESRRGSAKVRDAVAARYQQTLSYEEYLAAEAERALQRAQAEAEVARLNAEAIAAARSRLMEELEQWNHHEHAATPVMDALREDERPFLIEEAPAAGDFHERGDFKVKMYDELSPVRTPEVARDNALIYEAAPDELAQLEEEIEFRLAPELHQHTIDPLPIHANLIQFPRQLVAPRKARPRLAEGPLREDFEAEPQLRIFEVAAEQITIEPEITGTTIAPEWQSLQLGAAHVAQRQLPLEAQIDFTLPIHTAPLEQRLMAAVVDFCCIGFAVVGFAGVAAVVAGPHLHAVPLPLAGATLAGALFVIFLTYQLLFFTLNEATPGMMFARIGLCTFGDGNPSRKAMRRRILSLLLAACPLGLGVAWAALDEEGLAWHDRMSRMYPRNY